MRGVPADHNGNNGLEIQPTGSGAVTAVVTDSHFSGNGSSLAGVTVDGSSSSGTINATLSVSASANGQGIYVSSAAGKAQPVVMVTDSTLVNNQFGLVGNDNTKVFVDRTQISGNATGWQAFNAASVSSYKNNAVNGNGDDTLNGVVQISSE